MGFHQKKLSSSTSPTSTDSWKRGVGKLSFWDNVGLMLSNHCNQPIFRLVFMGMVFEKGKEIEYEMIYGDCRCYRAVIFCKSMRKGSVLINRHDIIDIHVPKAKQIMYNGTFWGKDHGQVSKFSRTILITIWSILARSYTIRHQRFISLLPSSWSLIIFFPSCSPTNHPSTTTHDHQPKNPFTNPLPWVGIRPLQFLWDGFFFWHGINLCNQSFSLLQLRRRFPRVGGNFGVGNLRKYIMCCFMEIDAIFGFNAQKINVILD